MNARDEESPQKDKGREEEAAKLVYQRKNGKFIAGEEGIREKWRKYFMGVLNEET